MNINMHGDAHFLNVSDSQFSVRSAEVTAAREASWYANTPYGIAILRYAELKELLRHKMLRQGSYAWPALNNATGSFARWWMNMMLGKEGGDHARLRKLANPAFSPKIVRALLPSFHSMAEELTEAFVGDGRCEYMRQFSEPYATRVVCKLLGIPEDNWRELADITVVMGQALGVSYFEKMDEVNEATDRMFAIAEKLVVDRRSRPAGEDFLSTLLSVNEASEDALSHQEMLDMIVLTIFAGIDTTRNQLGLGIDMFIQNPQQWELLRARPDLAEAAVDEVMRARPTVTWVTREAVEDFEYQGLRIARGATLHLFSQSACSDPSAFPDPEFDIAAQRKTHFGFGGGIHHCLGNFIARADMQVAFEALSRKVSNIRYDGEPVFLPDSGNTGPLTLPIKFEAVA